MIDTYTTALLSNMFKLYRKYTTYITRDMIENTVSYLYLIDSINYETLEKILKVIYDIFNSGVDFC